MASSESLESAVKKALSDAEAVYSVLTALTTANPDNVTARFLQVKAEELRDNAADALQLLQRNRLSLVTDAD